MLGSSPLKLGVALVAGSLMLIRPGVAEAQTADAGPRFSAGGTLGYNSGFQLLAFGRASDFAKGLPFAVQLGLGYTSSDAGDPAAARRVFINNATNGIPRESGHSWDLTLDAVIPTSILSLPRSYVLAGLRHSSYTANFVYVGGNEDFDITSSHWGIGGAVGSDFAIGSRLDMMVGLGLDLFLSSTLTGHDTSYNPDGTSVNPREDYEYSDADAAVGQPKFRPRLVTGLQYHF